MNEPVELTLLELEASFVAHPPPTRAGWRFTGRSVSDVRVFGDASGTGWRLFHEYD